MPRLNVRALRCIDVMYLWRPVSATRLPDIVPKILMLWQTGDWAWLEQLCSSIACRNIQGGP